TLFPYTTLFRSRRRDVLSIACVLLGNSRAVGKRRRNHPECHRSSDQAARPTFKLTLSTTFPCFTSASCSLTKAFFDIAKRLGGASDALHAVSSKLLGDGPRPRA